MKIPDQQLALFEQRLQAIGLGRRDFLKAVGGMAAFGGLGFATTAHAYKPTKPAPGDKLAKEQVFRFGGGGYYQNDPASMDFNKDLYCSGVPALFAGLMVFNPDFVAEPWMASKVEGNKDGSVWTFIIRKDSRWSDNSPVSARDFEYSWKRQLDPATAAPYASFLYDIKNGEAYNKKKITDAKEVGVRAKDDWTLEVTLEGPRGYFPVLAAYLATTIAYSLVLKRKMLVDVVTLAGLYTLRIIAGAVGVGVVLSEWLLIFSLFVFTSLALIKRFSELSMRESAGLADPSNRDYRITDLHIIGAMAAASAMNAVTVFSLYVSSSAVTPLYSRPWMLWLLNPLLLYWFGRALMMAHRREMPDDPILYTFRDGASRTTVAAMICIMLAAI